MKKKTISLILGIDPVVILLRDSASYIRTSSYAVGFNHHQWNNSYMQGVYRQAWKNHPCNTSIQAEMEQ